MGAETIGYYRQCLLDRCAYEKGTLALAEFQQEVSAREVQIQHVREEPRPPRQDPSKRGALMKDRVEEAERFEKQHAAWVSKASDLDEAVRKLETGGRSKVHFTQ